MSAAAPASLWRRARAWLVEPDAPLLGLEIRRRSVAALRLARGGRALDAAASLPLAEGVVEPSTTSANLLDVAALTAGVRLVVERVGGMAERRAALVLPDGVARLVFFDRFEPLEGKGVTAGDVVRFRLAERLRFDVRQADKVRFDLRQAEIAWHTWADGAPGHRVPEPRDLGAGTRTRSQPNRVALVVAAPRAVVAEYEGVLASCGLTPGQVEISSLALLRGTEAQRRSGDWLLVNWEPEYLTVFVTRDGLPLLVRTLPSPVSLDGMARELASTLRYHRERLAGESLSGALLRAGGASAEEARSLISGTLALEPLLVDPLAELGASAGEDVAQALAAVGSGLLASVR